MAVLKINCLVRNAALLSNLTNLMRLEAAALQQKNKKASFRNVFDAMRAGGIELDIQTAATLYQNAFNLRDPAYSNLQQVDAQSGKTEERIKKALLNITKTKTIGDDAPALAAVASFLDFIKPRVGSNPTIQKLMQDRLGKWARAKLKAASVAMQGKTVDEILKEALLLELRSPLTDPAGNVLGMLDNARRLQQEFKEVFADISKIAGPGYQGALAQFTAQQIQDMPYSLMLSHPEVKKIIKEAMIGAGFGKVVGANTVLDWRKIFQYNPDFRQVVQQVFSARGYTPAQLQSIQDSIFQDYQDLLNAKRTQTLDAKNRRALQHKTPAQRTNLDRLYELYDLGIFGSAQQDALFRVLGVMDADAKAIIHLENVARLGAMVRNLPLAEFSDRVQRGFARSIDREVGNMEMRSDNAMKFIRTLNYLLQLSTGFLVTTFTNITQGVISGTHGVLNVALSNPATALPAADDFTSGFNDVLLGGTRPGVEATNIYERSGTTLTDTFSVGAAHTLREKIGAGLAAITNSALGTYDAGVKRFSISAIQTNAWAHALVKINPELTISEARAAIAEAIAANGTMLAATAKTMAKALKAIGEASNASTEKIIRRELAKGTLAHGSEVFQVILDRIAVAKGLVPGSLKGIPESVIKAISAGAEKAAAQELGHESYYKPLQNVLDRMNANVAGKGVTGARKKIARNADGTIAANAEQLRAQAIKRAELWQISWGALTRLRYGATRWSILLTTYSTPFPGLISLGYRSSLGRWTGIRGSDAASLKELWSFPEVDFSNDSEATVRARIADAITGRAHLVRSVVGPLISYFIGWQLVLPRMLEYFVNKLKDDDEKEGRTRTEEEYQKDAAAVCGEWVNADSGRKRWVLAGLPVAVYAYLNMQTKGKPWDRRAKDTDNVKLPSVMNFTNPFLATSAFFSQMTGTTFQNLWEGWKREEEKNDPDYSVPIFNFGRSLLALDAAARVWTRNEKDARVLGHILTGDKTSVEDMTQHQKQELKDSGVISGIGTLFLTPEIYSTLTGVGTKGAPVSPKVWNDYERTGNDNFLPPVPRPDVQYNGYKFRYTPDLEKQWRDLLNKKYLEMTERYVESRASWDNLPEDRKMGILETAYTRARELAIRDWRRLYPLREEEYWREIDK